MDITAALASLDRLVSPVGDEGFSYLAPPSCGMTDDAIRACLEDGWSTGEIAQAAAKRDAAADDFASQSYDEALADARADMESRARRVLRAMMVA